MDREESRRTPAALLIRLHRHRHSAPEGTSHRGTGETRPCTEVLGRTDSRRARLMSPQGAWPRPRSLWFPCSQRGGRHGVRIVQVAKPSRPDSARTSSSQRSACSAAPKCNVLVGTEHPRGLPECPSPRGAPRWLCWTIRAPRCTRSGCCNSYRSARLAGCPRPTPSSRARRHRVRIMSAPKESIHAVGVRSPLRETRRFSRRHPAPIRVAPTPPEWLRGSADRAPSLAAPSSHHPRVVVLRMRRLGVHRASFATTHRSASRRPARLALSSSVEPCLSDPGRVNRGRVRVILGLPGQETSASRCHLNPGAPRTLPEGPPSQVSMPGRGPIPNCFQSVPRFSG
jgi:hypothetical protein